MKSVLYCGCTVNAYMPFHGEHILSFSPRPNLPLSRSGRSLSLSDSSRSTSLFARYLARWPPAQPMKARGGELLRRSYGMAGVAEGLGLLPPQRSYCFSHPNHPPGNHPGRATIPLRRLLPPGPSHRTAVPLSTPEFTSSSSSASPSPFALLLARERAPDCLLRHCA